MSGVALALAGGIIGYIARRGRNNEIVAVPQTFDDMLDELRASKRIAIFTRRFTATEARDNVEIVTTGDTLVVITDDATTGFTVRLNEPDAPPLDLRALKIIRAPFYRLFLSNVAGSGSMVLVGGRGVEVEARETSPVEVAARLGSAATFDHRGQIVWIDDFELTLVKWVAATSGTGAAVARSTAEARSGQYSVKLTAGSDSDLYARITHFHRLPALNRQGIEFHFNIPGATDILQMEVSIYDGTSKHLSGVRFAEVSVSGPAQYDLQYLDSGGTWTSVPGQPAPGPAKIPATFPTLFHVLKLVVDAASNKYVRIIYNNVEYDVSSLNLQIVSSTTAPHMIIFITAYGLSGQNHVAYIDDVIITQNEP